MKKLTLLITLILLIVSITISQTQNGRISPPSSNVQSLIQIDDPHSTTRGFKPKSHGMHADPNQIATYKQPDGSEIKFRQYGNGAVNWKETVDGQTILTNSDEYFVYAIATNDGDLAPSNIRVSADGEIKSSEEINLRRSNVEKVFYSQEKISELKASYLPSPTRAGPSRAFPTSGTRNLLVLLIDYPDASNSYPSSNFDNMMNQAGYNGDGSFKDYYFENSYGQLTMNTTVVGWYTAANSHDWYGDVNGSARAQTLVGEAVDAAQAAGVDFSIYDNDGDGNVDGVMVIHQGNGAEQGDNRDIWSHSWALNGGARSYDGVTINEYTINPETSSGSMGTIGVLCHEFGHNLGAPDWYDTDYATGGQAESLGEWDVMDAGSYNGSPSGCKPAHHNVFTKEFYGWLTITELVAPQSVTMANMEQNPVAYKYTTTTANEYFVLENRQQVGFDASIPGSGLIIYHVDGSYVSSHWNTNDINALASHEGFELEEADDSGPSNAGDAFPGSTSQTQFDDATSPNSRSWASANTNKPLLNISNSGGNVSFCYISCSPPVADFVGVPTTVPQGGTVNFTDLSTGTPTSWAWDFGDPAAVGSTTAQNPSVVYNTIGNHRVQLTATNGSGNDLESKNNYITVVAATCSDGVQNGTETGIDCGGSCTACGPCGLVTPITCGVTQTYSNVGSGDWDDADGCYASPGKEQIYSIVAPVTGTYSIEVTSTNGKWLDYGWKASSCSLTGWKCIKDVMNAGTYDGTTEDGPMSWTAGTTYYLVLDAESVVLTTHDFYIDCPTPKTINTITYNQASTVDVYRTSNENEILRIDFDVTGTVGTLPLNSLQVTSNNISDADIAANGVKLYTTTTTTFSTANPLGTAQSLSGGVATFNGLNYDLPTGVTYVWVVYDIDAGATVGNTVDALIATNDIDVDGTTYPGSDESPAGTRTIISEPCGNIIPITCGVSQTFTSGGAGLWANPDGCNSSSGKEQIYSIVAPLTGTYNIEVTSTGGYVDYAWQASSCAEAGWTCIGRVSTTGTKSDMSWTAGTTYYIILDDENTTASTHQFYIDCPQLKSLNSITYVQASTADVLVSTSDNKILRIGFDVTGTAGTLPLNSIQLTSNNIDDADIPANGVKLYWTTTTTFSTANLLGTAQSFSGGLATFSGFNYDLPTGMTYVWVAYDIAAGATSANTVDAIIATNDIDVDGTTYPASDESPAGNRMIRTAYGPCGLVIPLTCGVTGTYTSGGSGDWANADGCFLSPGTEQIYSIIAPATGTYTLEVTSTDNTWVDYGWKASSCSSTSWNCITDLRTTGTYDGIGEGGPMSWTAGTTYYLVVDDEDITASTHEFYINCPISKTLNSITYNQASTADLYRASNDNEILRIDFDVIGTGGTLPLNSLQVTSNNIADADIAANGVKLYWTSTTTFSTDNLLETAQSLSGSVATFNGLSYELPAGMTYVWVVYDIDAAATIGNTVDALIAANDIDVSGTTYPGSDESPAGTRPIVNGPCENAIAITCGVIQTYTSGGAGIWTNVDGSGVPINPAGCDDSPGVEQVYSFVAPFTGTYNIEVTSADASTLNYAWQENNCDETSWTCIDAINATGTYGALSWTAGTTYYIMLDDENTTASTHEFYIDCPTAKVLTSITYNQASINDVPIGGSNKEILRIDFTVEGTLGTLDLNSLVVTSNNITDADIAANGVKLYTTTVNSFSTANLLGTAQSFSGGTATFNALAYDLPTGTSYVWVAYNIAATATALNTVDALIAANDIDVDGTTYPGSDESPAGSRLIVATGGEDCSTPLVIGSLPYNQTSMTTAGFGSDYDRNDACGSYYLDGDDFIFEYTPAVDECVNIDLTNTDEWVGVFVFDGCPDNPSTNCVADANDGQNGNPSLNIVQLTGGITYYIGISTNDPPQSTPFDINIETTACPVGPGADCGDPYIIASLPFSETGMNTAGFGDDYNSTHACNNTSYLNGDDFVFSYTPAVDECIEVVLHNTALDGIGLFAYDNCVLDNADCMTYVKSGVEDVYIPNLPVTGGVTYYFIVSSDGSPQNTPFDIEVNTVTCIDLSNDDCPTAITLVQNELCDPTPGSYLNAQDLYADCAETGKEDVWYKFVATTSTPIVAVYGTEDYYIELFSGSCAGSSLQCDKGQQITTSGLTIGNTYYVKASPEGFHFDYTFDICVFDLLPADPCASNPPADDLCGSATLINNLDGFCGNTSSSYGIDEVQLEGNPFCGSIDNNSWLSFIADSVAVQLSIYTSSCTAGEGIQMQIYETPDCNTFTPVSTCWDPAYETNGIVMADGLTVGNTYHLMIDGWNGDDCDYVISAPQGSGVQLPIELVSFSCNKYNGNTTLYWETASENNNDYFEIERSDDGQFFVVVDVVQGAGNSNELIEYQWEDRSTSEKQYYYRLKQYDYDGHYSNSDITICRESNNNLNGLTYNYNQDDNTIEVYFMDENSNQYNLVVYDCVGKLIVNERLSGSKVRYKVQLPEISKGIYYMNINGYDGNVTEKILKY